MEYYPHPSIKEYLRKRSAQYKHFRMCRIAFAIFAAYLLLLPLVDRASDKLSDWLIEHGVEERLELLPEAKAEERPSAQIEAYVTGYNTVPEQTDDTPCVASRNVWICGRTDVVACPRQYGLGTEVDIRGSRYVCLDRTNEKYDGRWDISCDKDMQCPPLVTGTTTITIYQ